MLRAIFEWVIRLVWRSKTNERLGQKLRAVVDDLCKQYYILLDWQGYQDGGRNRSNRVQTYRLDWIKYLVDLETNNGRALRRTRASSCPAVEFSDDASADAIITYKLTPLENAKLRLYKKLTALINLLIHDLICLELNDKFQVVVNYPETPKIAEIVKEWRQYNLVQGTPIQLKSNVDGTIGSCSSSPPLKILLSASKAAKNISERFIRVLSIYEFSGRLHRVKCWELAELLRKMKPVSDSWPTSRLKESIKIEAAGDLDVYFLSAFEEYRHGQYGNSQMTLRRLLAEMETLSSEKCLNKKYEEVLAQHSSPETICSEISQNFDLVEEPTRKLEIDSGIYESGDTEIKKISEHERISPSCVSEKLQNIFGIDFRFPGEPETRPARNKRSAGEAEVHRFSCEESKLGADLISELEAALVYRQSQY